MPSFGPDGGDTNSPLPVPEITNAPLNGSSNIAPPAPPTPPPHDSSASQPSFWSDYSYYFKNPSKMDKDLYYTAVVAWSAAGVAAGGVAGIAAGTVVAVGLARGSRTA